MYHNIVHVSFENRESYSGQSPGTFFMTMRMIVTTFLAKIIWSNNSVSEIPNMSHILNYIIIYS